MTVSYYHSSSCGSACVLWSLSSSSSITELQVRLCVGTGSAPVGPLLAAPQDHEAVEQRQKLKTGPKLSVIRKLPAPWSHFISSRSTSCFLQSVSAADPQLLSARERRGRGPAAGSNPNLVFNDVLLLLEERVK